MQRLQPFARPEFRESAAIGGLTYTPAITSPWRHNIIKLDDLVTQTRFDRLAKMPRETISDPESFSWIAPDHREAGGKRTADICVRLPGTPYILPDNMARHAPLLADMITAHANASPLGVPSTYDTCWLYFTKSLLGYGDTSRDIAALKHTDLQLGWVRHGLRNTTNVLVSDVPDLMTEFYFRGLDITDEHFLPVLEGNSDEATSAYHDTAGRQFSKAFAQRPEAYQMMVYDGITGHNGVICKKPAWRTMVLGMFSTELYRYPIVTNNPALDRWMAAHGHPQLHPSAASSLDRPGTPMA